MAPATLYSQYTRGYKAILPDARAGSMAHDAKRQLLVALILLDQASWSLYKALVLDIHFVYRRSGVEFIMCVKLTTTPPQLKTRNKIVGEPLSSVDINIDPFKGDSEYLGDRFRIFFLMHRTLVTVAIAAAVAPLGFAVNVSLPLLAPSNSQPLSRTLLSLSIEQDRWPDWTGIQERNQFTYNALQNLAELTGQPPKLRVGADSEDNTFWSPIATIIEDTFPPPTAASPYPEATNITVNDTYYTLSRFLPEGTHFIWGVNFGADNVTNAINMARAIFRAFSDDAVKSAGVVLDRLEIGNEPDFYNITGHRTGDYTVEDYVSQWEPFAGAVVDAVGIRGNTSAVTLQGAAFAIPLFPVAEIFRLGILNSTAGKAIST